MGFWGALFSNEKNMMAMIRPSSHGLAPDQAMPRQLWKVKGQRFNEMPRTQGDSRQQAFKKQT
jgi:hypothetical protein